MSSAKHSPRISWPAVAVVVFVLLAALVLIWRPGAGAPGNAPRSAAGGQGTLTSVIALPPSATPMPAPITLAIAYSNDTWGYLFPCG